MYDAVYYNNNNYYCNNNNGFDHILCILHIMVDFKKLYVYGHDALREQYLSILTKLQHHFSMAEFDVCCTSVSFRCGSHMASGSSSFSSLRFSLLL